MRHEPAHPHGWFGYVVSDAERTANALRLARGVTPAVVGVLLVLAAAVVAVAIASPAAAVGLLGGGAATAAGGAAVRRRRHRRRKSISGTKTAAQ